MTLPFSFPLEVMLAKAAATLPEGEGWLYEPKWDGFRTLVFRDGDEVYLQSRDKKPLLRYFPELLLPIKRSLPERCVLDGEVVLADGDSLDFEMLQMRLHPAASRIQKLAEETPASFVAFDLIALGDEDLRARPQIERRERLEAALKEATPPIFLTPATTDRALAADWFKRFEGAGLDGVMAKRFELTYQPKKRAMLKIKQVRTVDCVVAGFRWHKNGPGTLVGSLLLGLYDEEGKLHHAGITASFKMEMRAKLARELAPLREDALVDHPWADWASAESTEDPERRRPGMESRWSQGKDLSWIPIRIEKVCEVKFGHLQGSRFRHATTFKRWRPDKAPKDCTYEQIDIVPAYELRKIFGTNGNIDS